MITLNIIDKIYENTHFTTCLIAAIILLAILFIAVLIIGIKDAKKSKEPKKEVEEEVVDITFTMPTEADNIKEDVTFEMPVLTKNLEDFKKNLEEEIQKEDIVEVRKTSGLILPKETKPIKILDMHEIEDTAIIPIKKEVKEKKESPKVEPEAEIKNVENETLDIEEIPKKKENIIEKLTKSNKEENVDFNEVAIASLSSEEANNIYDTDDDF